VEMSLWIAAILVGGLLAMQALLRFVLRPLRMIEKSARDVQHKRFGQIAVLPRAPELARVVRAMNDMSRRVAEMLDEGTARAEALRKQAYEDELTGLANRRGFELRLKELFEGEYKFSLAAMIVVELDNMRQFIRARGFDAGLAVMRIVARSAEDLLKGDHYSLLARSNEHTFSFVLAGVTAEQVTELATRLRERLARGIGASPAASVVFFNIGVAYFRQDDKRSEIFARGDLATESARHAGHDGLVILPEQPDDKTALGSFGWRMLIQNALKENRWRLMAQPVVDLAERGRMLHGEMMARLVDGEGNLVPASQFLPMAVRHDLMPDIDRGLVSLALDYLRRQTDADKRIAINLSPQSVANAEFVAWLGARLAELKADARRLLLEISEFGCLRNVAAASEVMALARRHGARFGIDHFGLDPQSLRLMREMPPDYVKLNGGLVGAMATDEDARAVVESIVQLAHSLEVQVIAQNVEDEAQVGVLLAVAVDGGQGYLFGAPA